METYTKKMMQLDCVWVHQQRITYRAKINHNIAILAHSTAPKLTSNDIPLQVNQIFGIKNYIN